MTLVLSQKKRLSVLDPVGIQPMIERIMNRCRPLIAYARRRVL